MYKTWKWKDRKGRPWHLKWVMNPDEGDSIDIYGYPLPYGSRAYIFCTLFSVEGRKVVFSDYAELLDILVPPEFRRRGVCSYLLDTVTAEVKRRGFKGIKGWLARRDDLGANKKFYESKGFAVEIDKSGKGAKVGKISLEFGS